MLCQSDNYLNEINKRAKFIVADGMPLVWASYLKKNKRLPQRVTGAELVNRLCERAAKLQASIFIFGAYPGQAELAGNLLSQKFPGLRFAGSICPPFGRWTETENVQMIEQIHQVKPDILFVALGQPFGEKWVAKNYQTIGASINLQIGGSFDFITGRVRRAPKWMQRCGLEWIYRFYQEPKRLFMRYYSNIFFLVRMMILEMGNRRFEMNSKNISIKNDQDG